MFLSQFYKVYSLQNLTEEASNQDEDRRKSSSLLKGREDSDLSNISMMLLIILRRGVLPHLKSLSPIPKPLKKKCGER